MLVELTLTAKLAACAALAVTLYLGHRVGGMRQ